MRTLAQEVGQDKKKKKTKKDEDFVLGLWSNRLLLRKKFRHEKGRSLS